MRDNVAARWLNPLSTHQSLRQSCTSLSSRSQALPSPLSWPRRTSRASGSTTTTRTAWQSMESPRPIANTGCGLRTYVSSSPHVRAAPDGAGARQNAVREINGDPCGIAPFGVAVVNTTSNELVCVAANRVGSTGSESFVRSAASSVGLTGIGPDPTQHGEITGLDVCSDVLRKKGLSPKEMLAAWKSFTVRRCIHAVVDARADAAPSRISALPDVYERGAMSHVRLRTEMGRNRRGARLRSKLPVVARR